MALTKIESAGLAKPVDLAEIEKIRFGDNADLQIWHQGNSNILATSGVMYLHNTGSSATDIDIRAERDVFIKPNNGAQGIKVRDYQNDNSVGDGAVELYHNGTKKLETNIHGIVVTDSHDTSVQINLNTSDTDTHGYVYADTSDNVGFLTSEGEWAVRCVANGGTELRCDNNPKLVTTTTGVNITGDLKFESNNGINFHNYGTGTNVESNLLDDYEEGSWTPAWKASGTDFGDGEITYNSNTSGRYVKIGKQVTVWMYIQIATINTSNISGAAEIINLPFTAQNGPTAVDGATLNVNYYTGMNGMGSNVPSGYVELNQTEIRCHMVGGNSQSPWYASYLGVGGLYACATYMAA
mgnify:CR=1 FL=1